MKLLCKSLLSLGVLVGIAGITVGCATTEKSMQEKGLKPISEAEWKSLHARDRTIAWTNARNQNGTLKVSPSGSVVVDWGSGSDTGVWRFTGDGYCAKYKTIRNGAERCFRMYNTGPNEYTTFVLPGGEYDAVLRYTN